MVHADPHTLMFGRAGPKPRAVRHPEDRQDPQSSPCIHSAPPGYSQPLGARVCAAAAPRTAMLSHGSAEQKGGRVKPCLWKRGTQTCRDTGRREDWSEWEQKPKTPMVSAEKLHSEQVNPSQTWPGSHTAFIPNRHNTSRRESWGLAFPAQDLLCRPRSSNAGAEQSPRSRLHHEHPPDCSQRLWSALGSPMERAGPRQPCQPQRQRHTLAPNRAAIGLQLLRGAQMPPTRAACSAESSADSQGSGTRHRVPSAAEQQRVLPQPQPFPQSPPRALNQRLSPLTTQRREVAAKTEIAKLTGDCLNRERAVPMARLGYSPTAARQRIAGTGKDTAHGALPPASRRRSRPLWCRQMGGFCFISKSAQPYRQEAALACASPSTFPNAAGAAAHSSLPFISQQMLLELLLHAPRRHAQHHLDPCAGHMVPG